MQKYAGFSGRKRCLWLIFLPFFRNPNAAAAVKRKKTAGKCLPVNYRRKGLPFPESQRIIRMLGCRKLVFAERIFV